MWLGNSWWPSGPGFYYCGLASFLGQGTKIPRAVWPGQKKKAKYGFLRIVIVPGIGLGCLSFSCIGGSKDRIAAVCVILQILNACCPHELKKYEETLDAVSEELPS